MKLLSPILVLFVLAFFCIGSPHPSIANNNESLLFIDDMGDVPLFDQLTLMEDTGFVFDQEAGRIVEKMALGNVSKEEILFFYQKTLPQLGWKEIGSVFEKENERLMITVRSEDNLSIVTFRLMPSS